MKRKLFLLFMVGLLTSCTLLAQVTPFKLSDYKYRTSGFRTMRLNADLSYDGHHDKSGSNTSSFSNFITNDALIYTEGFSTDQRQHITGFNGNLSLNLLRDNAGTRTNTSNVGLDYRQSEIVFKKNYFIKLDGDANAGYLGGRYGSTGDYTKNTTFDAGVNVSAAIGKGRLEYVGDAQSALFILDALSKAGKIKSMVDQKTAYELAQLLTGIKNISLFDSRRRNIYQLTKIDSFFRANNLLTTCDAEAIAIINDNLFYGFRNDLSTFADLSWRGVLQNPTHKGNNNIPISLFNIGDYWENPGDYDLNEYAAFIPAFELISDQFFRQHGQMMYGGVRSGILYERFTHKEKIGTYSEDSTANDFSRAPLEIYGVFEKHMAKSLHWQEVFQGKIGFELPESGGSKNVDVTAVYKLGYYPTNRTVVEGTAMGGVMLPVGNATNYKSYFVGLRCATGYFINYSTVFQARLDFDYLHSSSGSYKNSRIIPYLKFTLLHYFF